MTTYCGECGTPNTVREWTPRSRPDAPDTFCTRNPDHASDATEYCASCGEIKNDPTRGLCLACRAQAVEP